MSNDPTEVKRRELMSEMSAAPLTREELQERWGDVWDVKELREDFSVEGFLAPFVTVTRKSDNVKGSLMFQGNPRFYFSFFKSE